MSNYLLEVHKMVDPEKEIFRILNSETANQLRLDQAEREQASHLTQGIKDVLLIDGKPQEIDGRAYLVTQKSMTQADSYSGRKYFCRLYSVDEPTVPGLKPDTVYGVFFDEDSDDTVKTVNRDLLRISSDEVLVGKINELGDIEPTFMPEAMKIAKTTLSYIKNEIDQEGKAHSDKSRGRVKAVASTMGGLAVFLGIGSGIWYGIEHRPNYIRDFDKKDYSLSGGTQINLGEEVSPEFSKQLATNDRLRIEKVPGLEAGPSDTDENLDINDGLRQVTMARSGECSVVRFKKQMSPQSRLYAWTDAINADGSSRADQFTVRFHPEFARVCLNGITLNKKDIPRVVFDIK